RWKDFRTYSLYAILHGESPCFPVELHNLGVSFEVLDSCDGLFVISKTSFNINDDLFLWNPSIRKLNKLPYSGFFVRNGRFGYGFAYGFGYVECQNDYQIVEIASKHSSLIAHVSVYSLRRNSWKSIHEFPSISLPKHVKFVKGKFHWITGCGISGSGGNAIWFNPVDEKFGYVALPNPSFNTFNWKLVSSSGNLCMTCDYRNKTDVWIMNEYGLAESWTIVGSIPKFVNKGVWPIFISHNDEILLQDVSGLVWWYVSTDDDTFDRPENQTLCECDRRSDLNLYVESLVSPNSS
ncbi:F-box/kelch-repeat protein At3g23880-like, partial [Solanum dulcamara]|uniref:F-box/kelch-repeat protein At3g23880-like n=1 Tax=Solanum dulcamara TaxID=45834 RepID=UPI0024851203